MKDNRTTCDLVSARGSETVHGHDTVCENRMVSGNLTAGDKWAVSDDRTDGVNRRDDDRWDVSDDRTDGVNLTDGYDEAVRYIDEIPRFTRKHPLEHTRSCLRRLGDPQRSFKLIHVAGTNGKGSTCAFLASILRSGGIRCGLFTSPHLVSPEERFVVDGCIISRTIFVAAFAKVQKLCKELERDGEEHPSYFEFLFLMAMLIFRDAEVPWVILETGLGGRLDATNSAGIPEVCVITSISLDHMQYLGNTVPLIAGEKAGIIKKHVPVVYDNDHEEASAVIRSRAETLHCRTVAVTEKEAHDIAFGERDLSFTTQIFGQETRVSLPFIAQYQVKNALLAIRASELLAGRLPLTEKVILQGLADTVWEGRMETVLPGVIIDGAHNADGILKLTETAVRLAKDHRLILLFAAVNDKDYTSMIREMTEKLSFRAVILTQVGEAREVQPGDLAEIFRQNQSTTVYEEKDPAKAFLLGLSLRQEGEILLASGSLYLAGEIKKTLLKRGNTDDRL